MNLFEEQALLEAIARQYARQAERVRWAELQAEEERRRMADEEATRAAHSYAEEA